MTYKLFYAGFSLFMSYQRALCYRGCVCVGVIVPACVSVCVCLRVCELLGALIDSLNVP